MLAVVAGLVAVAAVPSAADKRPNFVYVLCDDMNELLGDEKIISQTRVTTYAEVLVADSTLIQHDSLFLYASFCYFRFDDWTRTRRPSRIFLHYGR